MTPSSYSFSGFCLDPNDRLLRREDEVVELNARYFDALALLVREAGTLVTKDRFLGEVWRGVPVTDEALTQCIKTLRRQLGDQVSTPRFIETVPKHGYRFIAPVTTRGESGRDETALPGGAVPGPPPTAWADLRRLGLAGTLGGGAAGLLGGLLYGFATAHSPSAAGVGETSALLVLITVTILAGVIGGAGVALGIAALQLAKGRNWASTIVGGAAGGLVVGAFARLLGLDLFNVLLGSSPADITGGAEGALLGAAVGLALWLAIRPSSRPSFERSLAAAAILGACTGALITALGGQMMGGSLDLLAQRFPGSRLGLAQIGAMFGESGFGPLSQAVTGAIEGGLFVAGMVGALTMAHRTADVPNDDERGRQG